MTPQDALEIESPCVRECVVDQHTGFCRGCYRTLQEISYWVSYTPDERRRVTTLLHARKAAMTNNPS